MSSKNKIEQAKRRALRGEAKKFVVAQYSILGEVIKPRPRLVPLWVWGRCARIFLDVNKLRDFMENGIGTNRG